MKDNDISTVEKKDEHIRKMQADMHTLIDSVTQSSTSVELIARDALDEAYGKTAAKGPGTTVQEV